MSLLKTVRGSEGLTLFMVLFVMAFFLVFVTGGLFFAQLNLKIASNFKLATQAIEVADAGLHHALAVIPWVWDFDTQLNGGTPAGTVVSQTEFPSGSGFKYTVTAKNNPGEGVAADDTDSIVLLTSQADGPSSTKKVVEAYVRRSLATFTPPAALYINAASSAPALGSYYFDDDDGIKITGNDTNPVVLSNGSDDTAGPKASLPAIATTTASITTALKNEYTTSYNGVSMHDVIGSGSEPSITTTPENLDIDTLAQKFRNAPGAVLYLSGYNSAGCTSSDPCTLGTSSSPQITYIKDELNNSNINLKSYVSGYGVLVLEGKVTLEGTFKFYGLVLGTRSQSNHYISIEDNSWIYGGVLLGSYNEGDGNGKKVRFRVEDFSKIFYSSEALAMVDANWGSLLPKPPRVFAWLDK